MGVTTSEKQGIDEIELEHCHSKNSIKELANYNKGAIQAEVDHIMWRPFSLEVVDDTVATA